MLYMVYVVKIMHNIHIVEDVTYIMCKVFIYIVQQNINCFLWFIRYTWFINEGFYLSVIYFVYRLKDMYRKYDIYALMIYIPHHTCIVLIGLSYIW